MSILADGEDAVTVRLIPVPLRLQETTVIMSSQAAEARTVPVIQSVAESAAAPADHEPGIHFLTDDHNNTLVIARANEPDGNGAYEVDGGGTYEIDGGGAYEVDGCGAYEIDGTSAYEVDGVSEYNANGTIRSKSELLEYLIRDDGSVACKLCGEVLASRTHWYRHKYKLHVTSPNIITTAPSIVPVAETMTTTVVNTTSVASVVSAAAGMCPSPLFRCVHCNVFFKSRKGYMGHVSARHSNDADDEAVVTVTDVGATETVITTEVPPAKAARRKDACSRGADWEQQREKEEKLVADIIDRVRRECEAQGAAVSRRGYSRRSTVMNTCN